MEAPPVTSDPDVYTLAQAADAVVLVAEVPGTRSDELAAAVHHLDRTGATVLGAVLLPPPQAPAAHGTPLSDAGANVRMQDRELPVRTASGDLPDAEETRTFLHGS